MKSEIFRPFFDRTNLILMVSALVVSGLVFFVFKQPFSGSNGFSLLISFTTVDIFVMVVFVVNLLLGFISFNRDKNISYIFNGLTILCSILFLLALILRLVNPNG